MSCDARTALGWFQWVVFCDLLYSETEYIELYLARYSALPLAVRLFACPRLDARSDARVCELGRRGIRHGRLHGVGSGETCSELTILDFVH